MKIGKRSESFDWTPVAQKYGIGPIEAKAYYILGLLRHYIEGAGKLISEPNAIWVPAFSLVASTAELLGAVQLGDRATHGSKLEAGFKLLLPEGIWVSPLQISYSVNDLASSRHFVSHGSYQARSRVMFEPELFNLLLARAAGILDELGRQVTRGDSAIFENIRVQPVRVGADVALVEDTIDLLKTANAGTALLYEETWR